MFLTSIQKPPGSNPPPSSATATAGCGGGLMSPSWPAKRARSPQFHQNDLRCLILLQTKEDYKNIQIRFNSIRAIFKSPIHFQFLRQFRYYFSQKKKDRKISKCQYKAGAKGNFLWWGGGRPNRPSAPVPPVRAPPSDPLGCPIPRGVPPPPSCIGMGRGRMVEASNSPGHVDGSKYR